MLELKRLKKIIPFLVLFIIHSGILGYSFYKNRNRKLLFAHLMSNIGFAYIFEYFVLNLFKAYVYRPKVFKMRKFDNIFGAILSQGIFIPFSAIFITTFQFGWKVKLLFSVYFSVVEEVFIRLGVYRHNWWKTVYTFILMPGYFKLSDFWYKQLCKGNRFVQLVTLYNMTFVTGINLLFVLAKLRKIKFGISRYHSWNEHFIIVPLYSLVVSFISTYLIRFKNGWISWLSLLVIRFGFDKLLFTCNLFKSKLTKLESTYFFSLMTLLTIFYQKLVYGRKKDL